MLKIRIKTLALLSLCFFRFTLAMKEMEVDTYLEEDTIMIDNDSGQESLKKKFKIFNDLPLELQQLILVYYVIVSFQSLEPLQNLTFLDKIIQSYRSVKVLPLVCKQFKALEKFFLFQYKEQLFEFLKNDYKLNEADIAIPQDCSIYLIFSNILKDLANGKPLNNKVFKYVCKNKAYPLIALFIFLRLNKIYLIDITNESDMDGESDMTDADNQILSEKKVLTEIWAQHKNGLHLAAEWGNVELVQYLIRPIIQFCFGIDINAKNIKGQTSLALTMLNQKLVSKCNEYKGRTAEENKKFYQDYGEIIEILKAAGAKE